MSARKVKPVARASYSVAEFCAAHGIGRATVWRYMKAGKLQFTRTPGGQRRIPASEFNRIAEPQP